MTARWWLSVKCEKCDAEFPPTPYPLGPRNARYSETLRSIRVIAGGRGWTHYRGPGSGRPVRDFCPEHSA